MDRAFVEAGQPRGRVLVVADDPAFRRSLTQTLKRQRFDVIEATRIEDDLESPTVIVIDLDPTELLASIRSVRERSEAPVIVVSDRATEGDKISALDAGADDYLTRPFGTRELLARIRVGFRHARALGPVEEVVGAGPIRIDEARYEVTVAGTPVHLTPIEYRLLVLLARHAGHVVSRAQLLHGVWGPEATDAHYLRVHLSALRRKIEIDPARPRLVTVPGVGYRLLED